LDFLDACDFSNMCSSDDNRDGSFVKLINLIDFIFFERNFKDISCFVFVFLYKFILPSWRLSCTFFPFTIVYFVYDRVSICIAFGDWYKGEFPVSIKENSNILTACCTAVAAALSRDAEVYMFDEPSSYLDVKQRLQVARTIRSLKDEGKTVIVAEHDLFGIYALLSSLTDDRGFRPGQDGDLLQLGQALAHIPRHLTQLGGIKSHAVGLHAEQDGKQGHLDLREQLPQALFPELGLKKSAQPDGHVGVGAGVFRSF
jgi:hypothetical protein